MWKIQVSYPIPYCPLRISPGMWVQIFEKPSPVTVATPEGEHCMTWKSQSVDGKSCFARTFGAGADAGGCHRCRCSTLKWFTLISRVKFSFLKNCKQDSQTWPKVGVGNTATSEKWPKKWVFLINLIRILYISGTWNLCYLIVIRM